MRKTLVISICISIFLLIAISACTKKLLPTGALDATFTMTYTPTATRTPDIRYDIVVFKNGNPDMGQIVSIKYAPHATWTPLVVNPSSGLASFEHIKDYGTFDVKVSAVNSCYSDYQYQIDLKGSTVTVINRNDAPYIEVSSDTGFETFSVYPRNITYTVKLRTDYPYPVDNFTVEGLPASCAVNWDVSTSEMIHNNDFIKLYITTPPNYLSNITFTVKADKANCVGTTKIISSTHIINRAWSINANANLIYYKQVGYESGNCTADMDNYGIGFKEPVFTSIGFEGPVSWELTSIDLTSCNGQSNSVLSSCNNCNADMGCMGTYSLKGYKRWHSSSHKDCYSTLSVKIRFFNSLGLNTYLYFKTETYPTSCTDQACRIEAIANIGLSKSYSNIISTGVEQ